MKDFFWGLSFFTGLVAGVLTVASIISATHSGGTPPDWVAASITAWVALGTGLLSTLFGLASRSIR